MPILRDPLPLKEPPLLSSPLASNGGETLENIEIFIVGIELIGVKNLKEALMIIR